MRTKEQEQQMLDYLLSDRCSNYGYDYRMFRRISNQRYRARLAIRKQGGVASEAWDKAPLSYRLDWDTMSYTVGQSSNEEITNLLRQLVNPNASWVS